MGIIFDQNEKMFHLQAGNTSYAIKVIGTGHLAHLYWGAKVNSSNLAHLYDLRGKPGTLGPKEKETRKLMLQDFPQEYASYGTGDFCQPAYQIQLENGSTVTDLKYSSHKIFKGKPKLDGLPATYVENENEAETLEIELKDELAELKVILSYTVFEGFDAIARSVRFVNMGSRKLKLLRALSMNVEFFGDQYDFLHMYGAWARECHIARRKLYPGLQTVGSSRGASSPQHNPFVALLSPDANEEHGEAYGFSFVYSGNFIAQAEVDQSRKTRVSMGINPFDFEWLLTAGESFQTPEVVMVYSNKGIGGMSNTYHKLYRSRLCRGQFRDRERPVLVNNWEATYFNFNAEKIMDLAREAKNLGIELLVLDDGWFGKRDSDAGSLGDWFVHTEKLPEGLPDLVNRVRETGLQFGLWFEPEMVSPDSDLYRAHPDWCIHVPGRERHQSRNQLTLDYSRKEVCDAITKMVSDILSSAPITYVKWDMNRHMTEIGSAGLPPERQRETAHRYMLGLYRVLEEITSAFPHILFESCASGGGRFDPGMLYYMPQTWTSDDSDAVERLKIQYGTSIVYPASTMGAHVSAVPNHQVHRITPLETRGNVAMSGNFGYELDLTKFTEDEKETVKKQVQLYKDIRHIVQFGDMYRLISPFESNETAWMFVTEDKTEAFVAYFKVLGEVNRVLVPKLRIKGLDETKEYAIIGTDSVIGGDMLMNAGIRLPRLNGDYQSFVMRLKAVK